MSKTYKDFPTVKKTKKSTKRNTQPYIRKSKFDLMKQAYDNMDEYKYNY